MICNYHPRGNIPGKPVYKIGPPCADCPRDRSSCSRIFVGLCGMDFGVSNGNYLKYSLNLLFITSCLLILNKI